MNISSPLSVSSSVRCLYFPIQNTSWYSIYTYSCHSLIVAANTDTLSPPHKENNYTNKTPPQPHHLKKLSSQSARDFSSLHTFQAHHGTTQITLTIHLKGWIAIIKIGTAASLAILTAQIPGMEKTRPYAMKMA